MLFNNQWTEELGEHSEQQEEKKISTAIWAFLTGSDMVHGHTGVHSIAACRFFAFSQRLPIHPSGEINSPPPDGFS